jgi:hypothetical protein
LHPAASKQESEGKTMNSLRIERLRLIGAQKGASKILLAHASDRLDANRFPDKICRGTLRQRRNRMARTITLLLASINFRWHRSAIEADIAEHANF